MAHYRGDIVAGSLLVSESRKIADLLIQGYAPDKIPDKTLEDNLLQKRSPVTAKRQARLILNRLSGLDREFWYLIRDGSHDQAAQILLCSALKHTRLLGDFIRLVIQPKIKTFQKEIAFQDWNDFFEQCLILDPEIGKWSEATRTKIRRVIFTVLVQAGIMDSAKSRRIQPFHLHREVRELLEKHDESYILKCLEIFK